MGKRKAVELKALQVARLDQPGLHAVGKPAGLYLQVTKTGTRSWILRKMVAGKRRDIGLGAYPDVSLAYAQQRAEVLAAAIMDGRDPLAERRQAASAARAARIGARTFREVAAEYIEGHAAEWKNAKHAAQWTATLSAYAYPVIGNLLVRDVEKSHVLAVLTPIWTTKTETAVRLRSRMELILGYAMQSGCRPEGLNPARLKDNLDKILPKASKVREVRKHPMVPIDELTAFMLALRAMSGAGARALEFVALTAARSGEVRGATWAEVNLAAGIWTVPASRMKAGKDHRVPLSVAAVRVLETMPKGEPGDLIFPAAHGGMLSDMTLSACMRRMKVEAVPHGLRASFSTWARERTSYPGDMVELALAHAIADKTEAAYQRSDMVEKRRELMTAWADHLDGKTTGKVIPLRAA